MRGDELDEGAVFSYISAAQRVPADHPLRPIRRMTDEALKALSPEFDRLYSKVGRPSIPPERLLRALLLRSGTLRSSARTEIVSWKGRLRSASWSRWWPRRRKRA
jgi:hypothetical protein